MYFEELGDRKNPTIIMLHGTGIPQTFVGQYILAKEYHLVIPHFYGNGEEVHEQYDRDRCIDAVIEIVESLNKDKVNIVGFSLGAQLIIPILCRAEEHFDKAIMISPWVCKSEEGIENVVNVIRGQMTRAMKLEWFLKLQAKWIGINKDQRKKFISYCELTSEENLVKMTIEGVELEKYNEYRDIKIPMLALAGARENKEMIISIETLEKLNKNCKSRVIENFGHDIPYKNPKIFNSILTLFFNEDIDQKDT